MNNLLFIAITIALLYYFFYYLPQQKKNISSQSNNKPFSLPTTNQETQTDPKPDEEKALSKTLDNLIKGMKDLSRDLDK